MKCCCTGPDCPLCKTIEEIEKQEMFEQIWYFASAMQHLEEFTVQARLEMAYYLYPQPPFDGYPYAIPHEFRFALSA